MTPLSFKKTYVSDAPSLPLRMGHPTGIPIENLPFSSTLAGRGPCQYFFLLRLRFPVELLFANR